MANTLADIYMSSDARQLLTNKFVLFIGDSVVRGMYKDMVKLLQTNDHLSDIQLKYKGEFYFENDQLLEGGQKGLMTNDVNYSEVREYKTPYHLVKFYFITRCYSDYLKSICEDISQMPEKPDVVIMNSGCWDLTRYGVNSMYEYKQNLPYGIYHLAKVLPSYTVFLWTTTMPLSKEVKGGFMVPELEGKHNNLRLDVIEANRYAGNIINDFKLDCLDLHFHFYRQTQRRAKDGIHWDATAHRRITNLILDHLSDAWDLDTPGRLLVKADPKMLYPSRYADEHNQYYYDDEFEANIDARPPASAGSAAEDGELPDDLVDKIQAIKNGHLTSNDFQLTSLEIDNNFFYEPEPQLQPMMQPQHYHMQHNNHQPMHSQYQLQQQQQINQKMRPSNNINIPLANNAQSNVFRFNKSTSGSNIANNNNNNNETNRPVIRVNQPPNKKFQFNNRQHHHPHHQQQQQQLNQQQPKPPAFQFSQAQIMQINQNVIGALQLQQTNPLYIPAVKGAALSAAAPSLMSINIQSNIHNPPPAVVQFTDSNDHEANDALMRKRKRSE